MSHEAFQQAIFQEPDDDAVRLIYADWLDENGEPLQAEFIRVQCELATLTPASDQYVRLKERERELEHLFVDRMEVLNHSLDLEAPCLALFDFRVRRRGFPWLMYLELDTPADLDEETLHSIYDQVETTVLKSAVQAYDFENCYPSQIELLMQRDLMKSARELIIHGWDEWEEMGTNLTDDLIAVIAQAPTLGKLQSVEIDGPLSDQGLQTLSGSPHLKQLDKLNLHASDLSTVGLKSFASSALSQQLTGLTCFQGEFTSDHIQAMTGNVWPQLCSLELYWSLEATGIQELAQSQAFPNLAHLVLRSQQVGPTEINNMIANDSWHLCSLDLSYSRFRIRDFRKLVQAPLVERLHTLNLRAGHIGDQGSRALASSRHLDQLRHLDLSDTTLDASGLQSLAEGVVLENLTTLDLGLSSEIFTASEGAAFIRKLELPRIRHLNLWGLPIGSRGAQALAKKDWFHNIRILDLSSCQIGKTGAEALLEALDPSIVALIELTENNIPTEVADQFREQFGERARID